MARKPSLKTSAKKTVTAKPKVARKSKIQHPADSIVRDLIPHGSDTTIKGHEPLFAAQPPEDSRTSALINAFNWYNHFYNKKDAKQFFAQYLTHNQKNTELKKVMKVDDKEFITTYGWLARMTLRGLVLSDDEKVRMESETKRLIDSLTAEAKVSATGGAKSKKSSAPVANKPSVQDIMKDKAKEAAAELESVFDEYQSLGCKAKFTNKVVETLSKLNILPQHVPYISDIWKKKRTEYEEVLKGKNAQLVESYSHRTKTQVKNILSFVDSVIGDLTNYVNIKKASKAPRKRKPVPVEKLVSKLKYLKEFKDEASKLSLDSVHPTKIVGSSECYLYDVNKRKLVYLVADDYSKTFSVKGTTILGFDTNKSQSKTIRKPGTQLPEFLKLGRPAGRKYFTDIKAVSTTVKGRTNEHMLILRCF